jgi:uncharacterized protein (DUF934 family)
MPKIIKVDRVVEDDWTVLRPEAADAPAISPEAPVPAGRMLVPLAVWLAQRDALAARGDVGVWLRNDEEPRQLQADLAVLPVIAVDFPKFTDGRGYSIGYDLRRQGFRNELRAIGDVLQDQLLYLKRVGFDAFAVRADKDIEKALAGLTVFSQAYQSSWDEPVPAFKRKERAWPQQA